MAKTFDTIEEINKYFKTSNKFNTSDIYVHLSNTLIDSISLQQSFSGKRFMVNCNGGALGTGIQYILTKDTDTVWDNDMRCFKVTDAVTNGKKMIFAHAITVVDDVKIYDIIVNYAFGNVKHIYVVADGDRKVHFTDGNNDNMEDQVIAL